MLLQSKQHLPIGHSRAVESASLDTIYDIGAIFYMSYPPLNIGLFIEFVHLQTLDIYQWHTHTDKNYSFLSVITTVWYSINQFLSDLAAEAVIR